jgi:predicted dinucleotide-utilizing enzyme
MTIPRTRRVGIAGFGYIGRYVYERMLDEPEAGLAPAFVWNRSPDRLADIPETLVLDDLAQAAERRADLIVELAHPEITREHGAGFLAHADYMPLSVSALVDPALEASLRDACAAAGTRLLIPHGALVGVDNLVEGRENWTDVTITFEKHPDAIDFSECDLTPVPDERTVVFDGTAREIGRLFPRNVNTMVTCGLATVGLDACRAVLISDPALTVGIADVLAVGGDGGRLHSRKEQPMSGVSGTEMLGSLYGSIRRAAGAESGLSFV